MLNYDYMYIIVICLKVKYTGWAMTVLYLMPFHNMSNADG